MGKDSYLFVRRVLAGEEQHVRETLQRIVDLVGEIVRHGRGGRSAGLFEQGGLLLLLSHRHGGEGGKGLHDVGIFTVEGFGVLVRHDPDGAAAVVDLPGQEDTVEDQRRFDAHHVEEGLADPEVLGASTLDGDAAGAGLARKAGVEEGAVLAGSGDPAPVVLFGPILLDQADAGAAGSTEFDGGIDEDLQDGAGSFDESAGELLETLGKAQGIAPAQGPGEEGCVRGEIYNFETGV